MQLPNEPARTPFTIGDNRIQSERRFQALIEKSSDIIALINAQGQITYVSSSLTRLTGHLPEAFLSSHVLALVHADEQSLMRQMLADVLQESDRTRRFECRVRCENGSFRWFETTLTNLLHEPAVTAIVVNLHDISQRKQAEQEREKLFQERIALLESTDEFISVASHELKTPVTSLKGFTQLLYRRFKRKGDEEALRFLGRMDSQLNKLTNLINDLLDISRIRAGKLEYRDEPFDLDVLAHEIVENAQATVQTHHLLLENPVKVHVSGDRERIGQVLTNLLTNAIKYSPDADIVVLQVEAKGNEAVVSVQDFGIGIGKDHQQKIFDRFYQVNDKDLLPSGLGLGLYLAHEIVKHHHGRIWVESHKGEGSTFRFTLPLLEV
jgi:PAS domain S-box-containing protein